MTARKLTKAQAGQLGGFASARAAGPEGMARRGEKGGNTTAERYGREHFIRAAHMRHGRLTKRPRVNGANESSQEGK